MDPTACYLDMLDAMNRYRLAEARERAEALRDWLRRGGVYPPGRPPDDIDEAVRSVLFRTVYPD